ncbi:olfactory receptor 7G2-like [Sorex araneus]|uniref:olfactory receptor 7G2-like n=1 Tax=Sorex araneus TaxID=42254 RepID=UPI002433C28B|nr:olfactory receptor 7G2-like [Sorex araneus]
MGSTAKETLISLSLFPDSSIRFTSNLATRNLTEAPIFLLLGLTDDTELQPVIFFLFLTMYLVTLLGNLLIVLAVVSDPHLHNPMYFFLSHLSFTDICISTCTIPKMLENIRTQTQSITYVSCMAQTFFVMVFTSVENCLLGAMAYDRYVAICHPLRYTVIMNQPLCALLIALSLLTSVAVSGLHALMALRLCFPSKVLVPHFFCELAQLLKLTCSDTFINNLLIYLVAVAFAGIPISGIIFSYTRIISSVLRMPSAQGKQKAFSTCSSHFSIVSLFYGTAFGVYISSTVLESSRTSAIPSVMYIVVPQLMNPFIYSLRNKDMKGAVRRLLSRMNCFANNQSFETLDHVKK